MPSLNPIKLFQSFNSLNSELSDYEKVLTAMTDEMILRQSDDTLKEMNMVDLLISASSGGKWDYKPAIKKHISSYYHKTRLNKSGKSATVFGTMIPNDNTYLYDHDIWANIHYGYAGKLAEFNKHFLHFGARAHDLKQGHLNAFSKSNTDGNAVNLGIQLYEKYGRDLKKSDLSQEIFNNRHLLNRYERRDLIVKSHTVKKGDTVFSIARQNNIATEEIIKKNPDLKSGSDLKEGIVLNMLSSTEVKQLSVMDYKEIVHSNAYLKEHGQTHDILVEKMTNHFIAVNENAELTQMLESLLTPTFSTPTGTTYYEWQTQEDGKVRGSHAERNNLIYSWSNPPVGGAPGEQYNCRCFAEPFTGENYTINPNEAYICEFDEKHYTPIEIDDFEEQDGNFYDLSDDVLPFN